MTDAPGSGSGTGSAPRPGSATVVLRALASDHRQRMLAVLHAAVEPVSEAELATRTAERACESTRREIADATIARIRSEQYHVHLPKLVESGLVEWNTTRRSIAIRDGPRNVGDLLDVGSNGGSGTDEHPRGTGN